MYHLMVRRSYVHVRRTGEECDQLITVVNGACCDGVQLNTMNMRVKVKVDAFITLEPGVHRCWAPGLRAAEFLYDVA